MFLIKLAYRLLTPESEFQDIIRLNDLGFELNPHLEEFGFGSLGREVTSLDPTHLMTSLKWSKGPYNVVVKEYEVCNGPRGKNLTDVVLNMSVDRSSGVFKINYLSNTRIDQIKVVVSLLSGNTKKLLWTYKLNDPCKHFAAAALIDAYYKAPNCVVKKGTYKSFVNFDADAKKFLGNKFFYGKYILKAYVLSKEGNILCLKFINEFEKN